MTDIVNGECFNETTFLRNGSKYKGFRPAPVSAARASFVGGHSHASLQPHFYSPAELPQEAMPRKAPYSGCKTFPAAGTFTAGQNQG
jgi:hypothetical protein